MTLLLLARALAAPPDDDTTFADHLVLGLGGGVVARPAGDPLRSGGELWWRAGLTQGALDVVLECGRVEADTRIDGVYYQEWSPRLAFELHPRHGRAVDPFVALAVGAERVRGASNEPELRGESPFTVNPAWAPLAHAGAGLSVNLVGPAFLRFDARALLPWGPATADGAALRPAGEGLVSLELRLGAAIDRDQDGVPDVDDACPRQPEDDDARGDQDGCPDLDDDRDGVLEPADRCPAQAEDVDGFDDADGCLDADNDRDGILDAADQCRGVAEDVDGFSDDDGCPDLDNDQDGILDLQDACINDPETMNDLDDSDGCPDRK